MVHRRPGLAVCQRPLRPKMGVLDGGGVELPKQRLEAIIVQAATADVLEDAKCV